MSRKVPSTIKCYNCNAKIQRENSRIIFDEEGKMLVVCFTCRKKSTDIKQPEQ